VEELEQSKRMRRVTPVRRVETTARMAMGHGEAMEMMAGDRAQDGR
jgi:hypothetical protein